MKILLLDDERIALAMLEKNVRKAVPDAEITAFRKAGDIIEFVKNNKADAVFLDMNLPGMTGIEVAGKLADADSSIKVVFCTGNMEYLDEREKVIVQKPASVDDILSALKKLSCL